MATRDARRARPADSGAPYYLVAPAGWPTTMEVKRLFAAASLEAPVVGASSADAALARLDREPRCAAVLVHWTEQPRPAMNLLCAIKERGAPPVAAFHPQWNRDDVRRALQLGADCLLAWPFSALELTADLNALIADGTSHSRRLLLEKGGPSLLAPDAALWVETDDDWRSRLATLAERRRGGEPDSLSGGQPAGAAEPIDALLRAAAGGMTPPMAAAVLQVVQQGTGRLEQIAADAGVDPRLLGRIARTAFELAKEPSARVGMMRQLTEMAAPVDGPGDGLAVLATLKRAAQAVVQGAAPEGADEAFVEALGRTLGVARAVVVELAGEQRAEVARRLLYAEEMEEALDAARLALFTRLIQRGHRAVAAHDLAALTALLGLRSGVNGVQPSAIIDLLGRLDPPAGMGDLDLTRLAPFRAAVPEPGNELDRLLAEALDALLAASRPLGSVDLARLSALVAALRGGAAGLVGAATWRTLADLLGGRRAPSPSDRAGLQLLVRVAKALGASDAVARGRLVRALDEWVE
ncbi:MAG: hypothetical protein KC620_11375, partial [Myxococcales bacterium]|nr:hypothetical protein [Myxococcales bacterium]